MQNLKRRSLILSGLALALAGPASAQSGLAGTYTAEGRNPDGSGYKGTVQITEANGAVSLFWTVGSQNYSGTGRMVGRILTINWGASDPVVYVLMPNGALHGTWANGLGLERLTRR